MHVLYCPHTNHVLAVQQAIGASAPSVASIVGDRGLRMTGPRGALDFAIWATATTEREELWIPASELALRTIPAQHDAYTRPHAYVMDGNHLAYVGPDPLRLYVAIEGNGTRVRLSHASFTTPITFLDNHRCWIQIEGPNESDRRILTGVIQANDSSPWDFGITVDPNGPLAPVVVGQNRTYYMLVLVEGLMLDARTQIL
ncbi:MAG: hypothetical protein ACKV2T_31865 [Kofleriaceae bacterium]